MSIKIESKINQLLQIIPKGTVVLASWLVKQGYSHSLQQKYMLSNWLEPVGKGAFKRTGDEISLLGAVYALQYQANKAIHIGGRSSLALLGFTHYIEMGQNTTTLFAPQGFKLPVWFTDFLWNIPFELTRSNMLPPELALSDYKADNFTLKIANPARAMLAARYGPGASRKMSIDKSKALVSVLCRKSKPHMV